MKIKIINSGSDGNAYVVTDKNGSQLLIECGVKINQIIRNIKIDKLQGCIISHEHKDHSLSKENIIRYGIPVYDESNLSAGKMERIGDYKILPILSEHNVNCFGFIISVVSENKKILFVTDSFSIDPKTPDIRYDLAMLECNYSEEYVSKIKDMDNEDIGFYNHMSCERLRSWLLNRQYKPKTLCLIHLSNRGNLGAYGLNNGFTDCCEELYVAKKDMEFEIL